ncbi:MAG: tyrosine-type recombinase/integrase [Clostridiales bacterium]|nr:tyrosine-type recombinase/integrase [Clostridiales bacterium]MCF8021291.1 tyrosine-type recombinase/integrase [Clostridiales bacterium]
MSKKIIVFESILGELITGYIEEKRAVGYKYIKGFSLLKQFDTLAVKEHLMEKKLPKALVLLWTEKKPNQKDSTRNARISIVRGFAKYMVRLGYEAYVFPDAAVTIERYSYVPYIFSEEEMRRIFSICDNYPVSNVSPNRHLILPLIFRLLYGCGLRISEALNLTLNDVDLKRGTLFIRDTKFNKERIVPMAKSLTERCRLFASKIHSSASCQTFFFPSPYGGHYSETTIYKLFRRILWEAGISHSGKGPRLHDLRHSFSVHCLKKWVLNGEDLTNLLPYLSAYLGHVDLRGTQHYLRLTADLYPEIIASVERNFSSLIPEVTFHEAN